MSNLRPMIKNSSTVPLPTAPLSVCDKYSHMADATGGAMRPGGLSVYAGLQLSAIRCGGG